MVARFLPSRRWGVSDTSFAPIHPHLAPDTKSFAEALGIGNICEEMARERMHQQGLFRAVDSYCDRVTTDATGQTRSAGKRILLDGQWYIAPDFQASNGPEESYLIDLKAKQYHSYYHKTQTIQQVIDCHVLHDYLRLGAFYGAPVLILFHLLPAALMGDYGRGPTARIHTGLKWDPLTEEQRAALLGRFPVDDWYYLINARSIARGGRRGWFTDSDGRARQGYYIHLAEAQAGAAQGVLPQLPVWRSVAKEA